MIDDFPFPCHGNILRFPDIYFNVPCMSFVLVLFEHGPWERQGRNENS